MLIDLNKVVQEYVKVFGKKNVSDHMQKLFNNTNNNNKGEKTNASSKKKT